MPKASKSKGQSKISKAKAGAGLNQKVAEDKTFGAHPALARALSSLGARRPDASESPLPPPPPPAA
jgi:hypothetical protein